MTNLEKYIKIRKKREAKEMNGIKSVLVGGVMMGGGGRGREGEVCGVVGGGGLWCSGGQTVFICCGWQ